MRRDLTSLLSQTTRVLADGRFERLHSTHVLPTAGLPKAGGVNGVATASTLMGGLFHGIAQVVFQGNAITGLIFVVGLLISSWLVGGVGVWGSLIGMFIAWGVSAVGSAIHPDAFGFNYGLTAIALGSVFFILNAASAIYALLAVLTTANIFAAISALKPLGMSVLTAPFVLILGLFLLAGPLFRRVRPIATQS